MACVYAQDRVCVCMVNIIKFQTLSYCCSQLKCWLSGPEFTKCLSEYQSEKTLIRLLLQKQSDLGLHSLSRHFCRQLAFEI